MKKTLSLFAVITLVMVHTAACAFVEQNILLDTAFSMLEAGNPILERYNKMTGAGVQVRYELGLPYFYGGRKESLLMTIAAAQETTYSFTQGERYIYGFDCAGYTNWINSKTGRPQHDTLEYMITKYWKYRDNQLPVKDIAYDQLKDYLQVGDYLVANHNGRHIMMYIGTLADYGYTAEDIPHLAAYLDYPILIHCGSNPMYTERYTEYIEENNLNCHTTIGGVAICIVGMHPQDASHVYLGEEYYTVCFDLDGYVLTIYDIYSTSSYVWFRL